MQSQNLPRGCIHFTLGGVPTTILPSSWVVLLILGSSGGAGFELMPALIFTVAGMLCLLVHEYGHAFVCRAMGGGGSTVEIGSMGGVTHSLYLPTTRTGRILMIMAGPCASLLLGLLGGLMLGIQIHDIPAGVFSSLCLPFGSMLPESNIVNQYCIIPLLTAMHHGELTEHVLHAYSTLFFVCAWWSVFNLMPVQPLDGGKIFYLITRNRPLAAKVGIAVAALLSVFFTTRAAIFGAFICATLVYLNWKELKATRQ